jgi:dynein heavy chain
MLPRLSKKKVDAIISEAQDAEYKLEFIPSTTIEYVNSLVFLDEIQERVSLLSNITQYSRPCNRKEDI